MFRSIVPVSRDPQNGKVPVMTLAATLATTFERAIDYVAPAVLLVLGLAAAGAVALIGG